MKIIITDGLSSEGVAMLTSAGHEVVQQKLTPEELLRNIPAYDAIIVRSATKVTREVIDAGVQLKVIARGGVGLDNIDVPYAKERGLAVLNTPGASSISVAELAIAHMFAVCRMINRANVDMRNGLWPKKEYGEGIELTGKTLGLLGFGNIGREVAKRAAGLGMKVIAHDPYVTRTDLPVQLLSKEEVLATADFLSLHMPLIKGQGPAVGAPEFALMKKGVVIVNCARGGVVSEADLLAALQSGKVRAAGIDVFENEPITDAQKDLIAHQNVSVTPHIGASTAEAQDRVGTEIAQRVIDALR